MVAVLGIFMGCMKEPEAFPYNLYGEVNSIRIDPDSTSYFQSYRSAPEMGSVHKLFYGGEEGYSGIYSLIEMNPVEASFFVDTVFSSDSSTYSVMTIDNVDLILSLYDANDSLALPVVNYFSTDGDTNLFSQTESSYFTVDGNLTTVEAGNVTVDSDTLGNTAFRVDITDIFEEFILDTIRLNSNTFKISGNESLDSLISFYPTKMEVNYQRVTDYTDSTRFDTLSTTFTTRKKLTIMNPESWEESDDRFSVGRAKGIKSILSFNLDTLLTLSDSVVIKDTDLYLQVDNDEELSPGYKIVAYPLADSVDFDLFTVEERDTTNLEFLGSQSAVLDSSDYFVKMNLRSFAAYLQMGHLDRYQLQLSSSADNDPFIIHSFINDDSFKPYLKVRYVVTK